MARTRWPRRNCEPRPLVQAGQVRPGPRLPTLRPCSVKIREAGPEALSTLSLPITRRPLLLAIVAEWRPYLRLLCSFWRLALSTGGSAGSTCGLCACHMPALFVTVIECVPPGGVQRRQADGAFLDPAS